MIRFTALGVLIVLIAQCLTGCSKRDRPIVLYTSVDEPVARPIIDAFTKQTGIAVTLVPDTEATKSVGLAERLRAEKGNPRCDVFWGNEIFNTVLLADEGVFAPYDSPAAADVKSLYRDPHRRWTGVGVRARVIATRGPTPEGSLGGTMHQVAIDFPHIANLTDHRYRGKIAMARPAAGTTGGHVAALYALWGDAKGDAFFKALHDNQIILLGGNSDVANEVAVGNIEAGLTDNDDAANTLVNGQGVHATLPDQEPGNIGTLAVPTTVSLVQRNELDARSKRLIDYLLSSAVEQQLIDARFAGWSVRAPDANFHAMQIDYAAVAKIMPRAIQRATAILEGR